MKMPSYNVDTKVSMANALPRGFHSSNELIEHVCSDIELVSGIREAQERAASALRTSSLDIHP